MRPIDYARAMADSEIQRRGKTLAFEGSERARWDYTTGLFAYALWTLSEATGNPAWRDYAAEVVSSFIDEDGNVLTYRLSDYNIDMITPGRIVLKLYEKTGDDRYLKAAQLLRRQLEEQPRTSEGGFWHKKRYPYQMWLDGLYMGAPFYAQYSRIFGEEKGFDDVVEQILLIDRHAYDPDKGLHYHAWDEKREQIWANPETGASPHFWGRAEGWYAMALVDVLEEMPGTHHGVESIVEVLGRVADGIARYQDPDTGVWWQILDQPGRAGNYLEASASSMFVYALAKAVNEGYLPRDRYLPVIERGFRGILREFVRRDDEGRISLTQICEVAGLGYTNRAGRPRDGSFAYYISEPIVENDLKGVGPFILACIEVERLVETAGACDEGPVPVAVGWSDYERILSRIQAPVFPERDYRITEFGARPGGDASEAIRDAIQRCHADGGGRVVVPAGEFHTGPIHLRGGVNLHLEKGAVLHFSTDPQDYLPVVVTRWEGVECMNYSPLIYAYEQDDIAITGAGTLDGGANWGNWWSWNDKSSERPTLQTPARQRLIEMGEAGVPVEERVFGEGSFLRPNFIQFYRCRNVLIEGVKIRRSPMWEIHPVLCRNVTIRGVDIVSHGPNNDGCDPEASTDVLIEDCVFDTGDDCIAIKSGRNNDGRRVGVPSANIIVRNCVMKDGHGGVVIGSEISGGCRNVFVENCTMSSPNLDRALRFKSNARRGGVVEGVFMRNVRIGHVTEAVLTIDFLYEEGPDGDHPPTVCRVHIDNVESDGSPRVMWIAGFPEATIDDIRFRNCIFRGVSLPERIEHAGRVVLDGVQVVPAGKRRSAHSITPADE